MEMDSTPNTRWTVYDKVKGLTSTPETLMAEINSAISNMEYTRSTDFLKSPPSSSSSSSSMFRSNTDSDGRGTHRYDARLADEAFRSGCAALASGRLEEALGALNLSLANCPPDCTSAVSKLQSLIALTSQQLQRSNQNKQT